MTFTKGRVRTRKIRKGRKRNLSEKIFFNLSIFGWEHKFENWFADYDTEEIEGKREIKEID
jgi:hypothetical protein